jgi:pimeloyl-ACP methyl ester carboxylesterase
VKKEDLDLDLRRGRLRVRRFGDRSSVPVFCVPGLASNSRAFEALGDYRLSRGAGIVAFDLRGRGWSDITPPGTYGWERHALDLFDAADAMDAEQFDIVGHSMGAFVAMCAASLDRSRRIRRVVLIDGLGIPTQPAITTILGAVARLKSTYPTKDAFVDAVRSGGLVAPWNDYWEAHYRYDLVETAGGIRPRTSAEAVAEDTSYGATHNVRTFWRFMTMPTLLLRATAPLGGVENAFVVTSEEYAAFLRSTPASTGAEIAANHYGIVVDPASLKAVHDFLGS